MAGEFQVSGDKAAAPFTLKVHRGDGMALLAMNWKNGPPPDDFVGFAIEYKPPDSNRFFALKNRVGFADASGKVNPDRLSTLSSPIQKFRWVHFPRNAELAGAFLYRVTPIFMNDRDELSQGVAQEVGIELRRETYPGLLNVTFTRGFVSSQAFVDRYQSAGDISLLLPAKADQGLKFVPKHPKAKEALAWMGFEARHAILEALDEAIADPTAKVFVVAYDLSERDVVTRLEKLGPRLQIIIDDDGPHGEPTSGESQSAKRLKKAGAKVERQHMGKLQHNKTIVVTGKVKKVVCGSTNYTWRGFFVQANHAVILRGDPPVQAFKAAFDAYMDGGNSPAAFGATASAGMVPLSLDGIDASVSFSPHAANNALLKSIATDIADNTTSSLFYSLAFLFQTPGAMQDAIKKVMKKDAVFTYGISDKEVKGLKEVTGGIELQTPSGKIAPVFPAALKKNLPEPFKSEPTGGGGNRMHHKFVVIDFDKPTARVYLGSYNFSIGADTTNGENLLVIRDRRVAVSFVVEALRIFDHYHFRVVQERAKKAKKSLLLAKPPRKRGEKPWWAEDYKNPRKIRDRELFA
jgi:phosphatidylserine/phosphatidylglycerophosphate/cardiolipin synthase-like enzyme